MTLITKVKTVEAHIEKTDRTVVLAVKCDCCKESFLKANDLSSNLSSATNSGMTYYDPNWSKLVTIHSNGSIIEYHSSLADILARDSKTFFCLFKAQFGLKCNCKPSPDG